MLRPLDLQFFIISMANNILKYHIQKYYVMVDWFIREIKYGMKNIFHLNIKLLFKMKKKIKIASLCLVFKEYEIFYI